MDVETGSETLHVEVLDKDTVVRNDFLGQFSVGLDEFLDQGTHDLWFELEGQKPGDKAQGKLRLIIQYVHSKVKMLTGYINFWSE